MSRLSRTQRLPRWLAAIAIVAFVGVEAFCIYIFILNRRLTRELVNHSWREPTVIISAAHRTPMRVATLYGVDWRITPPVTMASLPDYVSRAFLAAEDVRFHHHLGIDPIGMARALFTNIRAHGIAAGGSTIDQQIIKARFLSQERTWRRKITEIVLAMLLDARMSKNEILEVYLNDVYLGHSGGKPVLGIDEASRLYFDKRPSQLRVDEAAVLAGMIRAPNRDTPEKRPDVVRARRDAILAVMRDHDWINDAQFSTAKGRGIDFTGGEITRAPYPFYLRALRADIVKEIGVSPIIEGGLTIVCEMDPDAQRNAERVAGRAPALLEASHSWIRAQARTEPLQVALLSVDPRDGGIRALVGGSDYNVSPFDRTSAMHRQPGSAFKTFAYLAAIASKKATTASLLLDAPVTVAVNDKETWQPHNYDDRYRGRVTLREAFEHSLNVPTVRLTEEIGISRVVDTAEKFGFEEKFARIPALPLGVTEVSMRELTAAYTPFPNLGVRVEPFLLREVRSHGGKSLYVHELEQKRVANADATYIVHTLLRGVVQRGTASRLKRYGLGYVAGKDRHDERLPRRLVRRLHARHGHQRLGRLRSRRAAAALVGRSGHPDLGRLHELDPSSARRAKAARRRDLPRYRSRDRHALAGRLPRSDPRSLSSPAPRRRTNARPASSAGSSAASSSTATTLTSLPRSRSSSSANGQTKSTAAARRWRGRGERLKKVFGGIEVCLSFGLECAGGLWFRGLSWRRRATALRRP